MEEILSQYPISEKQLYKRVRTSNGRVLLLHRFVMEKSLNKQLESCIFVHHKDEDKSNNNLDNLECISNSDHIKLHAKDRIIDLVTLICPSCKKEFIRRKNQTNLIKKGNKATYCSRECIGLSRSKGIVHGTMNTYNKYKCRCDLCNQVNRDRMNKYNASKRI